MDKRKACGAIAIVAQDTLEKLKVSSLQIQALLRAGAERSTALPANSRPAATVYRFRLLALCDRVRGLPDQRDLVVHGLRSKIRAGHYHVSSRRIVDAIVSRLTANRPPP
ncbi:MAG: hypothetical protein GIW99_01235 [Candidatus Eremiobacteraeota bacterium]|nr:hypothetical protein [Candidatus Eremiobacteraeota bacterium]MBC5826310.1 hypothetical protein [Candidatus Eremiobacteraeota bacterium]